MSKGRTVYAKLYDLAKRLVKFDKSFGVLANGKDNAYPERVERIINNSPTAKAAAATFKKYIAGRGVEEFNKVIVNPLKRTTLKRFIGRAAHSYSYQGGIFIHVNYNLDAKITSLQVIPYTHCRLGKPDSEKYSGKILISEDFSEGNKVKKDSIVSIDVYNPDKEIIKKQIKKAGGIEKYKGQVLFVNPSDYEYPLSPADNVLQDADSEYRAALYKNTILRKGFFGKTLVVTKPFEGSELEFQDPKILNDAEKYKLNQVRSARKEFEDTMESFLGAENSDGILHLEMEFDGDEIEKQIMFKNIDANINDKTFRYTEESVRNNIRKAFNNIPLGLIDSTENSFFNDSGRGIQARRSFYQDQTEEERGMLEETLTDLLSRFVGIELSESVTISLLFDPEELTAEEEPEEETPDPEEEEETETEED
jgi:hypothetical protein